MNAPAELYLSRARLRPDAPTPALRELLSGRDRVRTAGAHRLVWSLFGDEEGRRRDFLWREAQPGTFYLLSARPPEDRLGLFHLDAPKLFAPALGAGDRLHFALRANATIARTAEGKPGANGRVRGGRCDVVMDALHAVPPAERAAVRRQVLPRVAGEWLARQGAAHGFALAEREAGEGWEADDDAGGDAALRVMGYRVLRIDRGPRAAPLAAGVLDLEGTLVVREPECFLAALATGFGRARAFGCGLMLIRRTR